MDLTLLAHIVPPVLALLPGVHYDRLRRPDRVPTGQVPERSDYGRIVLSAALLTTATLLPLELLRQFGPRTLLNLGEAPLNGTLPIPSTGVLIWSVACFLMVSLTLASLAAAVRARFEHGSVVGHRAIRAADEAARRRRIPLGGPDIELEVKLTCGDTYRGLYGDGSADRGRDLRYLTLNGPIFAIEGHGKPLPLDALHGDRMLVPTNAITSVLVRSVGREARPSDPGVTVPGEVRPRHSIPRESVYCRAKAAAWRLRHDRDDPRLLAKALVIQMLLIAFVGLFSGMLD